MDVVTVFRHVPRPIIGLVGTHYDRAFEAFEATLDWLETTGILVERFDPATAIDDVARHPAVDRLLTAEPARALPVILWNETVISQGVYLSRAQLARALGQARRLRRGARPAA